MFGGVSSNQEGRAIEYKLIAADQNEVDILTQDHAENQKMISMLTDDLKQTDEQIGTMERAIVDTEHDMAHVKKSLQRSKSNCYEGMLTEQLTRVSNKLRGLKDDKHQSQADARRWRSQWRMERTLTLL
ncbi:hypothetical protein PsorP6_009205 [Peronosclerospora sorghi]|uniref:Uncharacterized protein n=1 Tax=Peronosclerospora sorghi TaxID=230839 RepID=A0ACC0VXY9_9STRA|nr:hypothetical protein PsorP6_009205 [Peronosclerospora sorghi]